ncbi:hypothetical protein ACFSCX_10235 [Bacillus salitolerans]|uniref:Uncharacterized protein n=1 Tax=Bacillus salitolerans TaxID=1437434 RepID=A0ABW4LP45_9BACI
MGCKTINTAMKDRIYSGNGMKTTVALQEFCDTNATYVIKMSREQILEFAQQLITHVNVMDSSRLRLTIFKNRPNSISITEY